MIRPGVPAALHAVSHARYSFLIGLPLRSNTQGDYTVGSASELLRRRTLRFQNGAKLWGEGEQPPFFVLRGSGFKPEQTGGEIDLMPLEREQFTRHPPSGDIGHSD